MNTKLNAALFVVILIISLILFITDEKVASGWVFIVGILAILLYSVEANNRAN